MLFLHSVLLWPPLSWSSRSYVASGSLRYLLGSSWNAILDVYILQLPCKLGRVGTSWSNYSGRTIEPDRICAWTKAAHSLKAGLELTCGQGQGLSQKVILAPFLHRHQGTAVHCCEHFEKLQKFPSEELPTGR